MTVMSADLEVRFRWVTAGFIVLFSAAFGAGLALHVWKPGGDESQGLLQAGLVLLMVTPAARLVVALMERIRRRDWLFVLMTVVVAIELAIVMWRASQKI